MKLEELSKIRLGDMAAVYSIDRQSERVGMTLVPLGMENNITTNKDYNFGIDSLVQLKLIGDAYPGVYSGGTTLRNSESTQRLKFLSQDVIECNKDNCKKIITVLKDDRNYLTKHVLTWFEGETSVEIYTEFINNSQESVTLEMISSFSLGNITPFIDGDAYNQVILHRLRSRWSNEGRLETVTLEDLQLEPSWTKFHVNSERFGQVGSLPVKRFFPFAALEDITNNVLWGAQLAISSSWQMEVYRRDDGINLSGGIADREFGHWMKKVKPKESFITPIAIVTVCKGGGIDNASQRLTKAGDKYVNKGPECEQNLPILFNEYCTTWGCPSRENIAEIVKNLKGKGIEYFVIDAGWFKPEGETWDSSMGDYEISKELFPEGLDKTVLAIREAGMKPGIWFEIENVARASKVYNLEEHLLKRDGQVLSTESRRFWDMRDPWVQEYLSEKVIKLLKDYGFEYMKIDYNDTMGIGCDGSDSLGEGLRENIEAAKLFIQKVKDEVPNIVIENCASGGHRLEPSMMRLMSMSSFSDAHECEEMPALAANLHRAILPRQSQIWAVIRKSDSLKRICYSIVNTFLGRMCFSGDVTELTKEQWNQIERGMDFYRKISPIIKEGFSHIFGPHLTSYRHPEGWQGILRMGNNGEAYVTIHTFNGQLPEYIEIALPKGCPDNIVEIYCDTNIDIAIDDRKLRYKTTDTMKAVAIFLK
ncbi:glycoside hydrolase family 36 protein [Clostridium sp.]|uniref:glycoside hydrolase family 36 protein n=1 Tax=Clostridium sp. TaxID=1506 RepID=UPI0026052912|nr:glycoside hydrolase family 36 protein [Clostridium sp.]